MFLQHTSAVWPVRFSSLPAVSPHYKANTKTATIDLLPMSSSVSVSSAPFHRFSSPLLLFSLNVYTFHINSHMQMHMYICALFIAFPTVLSYAHIITFLPLYMVPPPNTQSHVRLTCKRMCLFARARFSRWNFFQMCVYYPHYLKTHYCINASCVEKSNKHYHSPAIRTHYLYIL